MKRATRPPMPDREMRKVKPVSKWKVYGWSGFRTLPGDELVQSCEFAIAPSKAAIVRGSGGNHRSEDIGEMENSAEMDKARSKPGTIFYCSLNARRDDQCEWFEAQPEVPFDQPFKKKGEPTQVTLWVVTAGRFAEKGEPPKLYSLLCKKHVNHYAMVTSPRGRYAGDAFGFRHKFEFGQYEEDPQNAIARYIREKEDSAVCARAEADECDALAGKAALLYLREPDGISGN
ncbi:MAG: hypothetical protein O7G84_00990 [Gammaproteobacteria bacterium]|nr:hypothetical protein [Gammaproteobacteria bacterium]